MGRKKTLPFKYIGASIRQFRIARSLTQQQLQELSGVALSNIAPIERGAHDPSIQNLIKIARALNASIDVICGLQPPYDPCDGLTSDQIAIVNFMRKQNVK